MNINEENNNLKSIKMNGIMNMKLSSFQKMEFLKKKQLKVEYEGFKDMIGNDICLMYPNIYVDMIKMAVCVFS